jgi:hypothetical protein
MNLDAETILLCSRIATERTRPAQWQTAAELRKDAARVQASGQSIEGVQAWLRGLLGDALKAQATGAK